MSNFEYESEEQQEVFEYLDRLRESGRANMFGVRSFIVDNFNMKDDEAARYLMQWMGSFSERHPSVNNKGVR